MNERHYADVLIIGSGAAGLAAAIQLADQARVIVLSKDRIDGGSTNRAQGGIAAVTGPGDSPEDHIRDTMRAGAGLCDEQIVRYAVEKGPEVIERLIDYGLLFDTDGEAAFHLTREGDTAIAASCMSPTVPASLSRAP